MRAQVQTCAAIEPHSAPDQLDILARKDEHIDYVLSGLGQSTAVTGFDEIRFVHNALPELHFDQIDLSTRFLSKRLSAPLLISSMTGGPARARFINQHIAEAAETLGIAFGVGSQRVSLEGAADAGLGRELRKLAPHVPLLANIGGAQLAKGWGLVEAQRAVDALEADGLIVHLNPLQEAVQPGGDRDWRGVVAGIADLARGLRVPLIVKETGCGLSSHVVRRLVEAGVHGVDVAGAGGTNWGSIEGARVGPSGRDIAAPFADWGAPTCRSVRDARSLFPHGVVIASGGVRHGLDAARAIRMGADLAGQAAAVLPAAMLSTEAVVKHFEKLMMQMRIVCFCTGSENLRILSQCPLC